MCLLEKAIRIAAEAHAGQKERSGAAYILHPLRVMLKMQTETEMITAVLHDVVEDNQAYSLSGLRNEGVSEEILQALDCVTRRKGESYEDFIGRIEKNRLATKVKLADLADNMRTLRLPVLTERDLERLDRYHKAFRRLEKVEFEEA